MKKGLVLLALVCVLLSFVACGTARERMETVDEAYQRGYNEGYDAGYDNGYETGHAEMESLREQAYEDIERIIAMLDDYEIAGYDPDDIYDALCKASERVLNYEP